MQRLIPRRTLCDHIIDEAHLAQATDGQMSSVRPRIVQNRPTEEAPGPIPLPGFVTVHELGIVDGPIALVLSICPICPSVVR